MRITASTLQYTFPDIKDALQWYRKLFGRTADFVSSDEFQEWEIYPNFWIQIAKGDIKNKTTRLRFGVVDVEKTKQQLENDLNITCINRFYTPEVVLLYNFEDPWGYPLGIFQDLQKFPINK